MKMRLKERFQGVSNTKLPHFLSNQKIQDLELKNHIRDIKHDLEEGAPVTEKKR
jgi:hypothetical protein